MDATTVDSAGDRVIDTQLKPKPSPAVPSLAEGRFGSLVHFGLGMLEDGGERVIVSFMLRYAFQIDRDSTTYRKAREGL